jgi:hypothetical protein
MTRKQILETAIQYTTKDRNIQNGEPEENFQNIADYWNLYLDKEGVLKGFGLITPLHVGMMMVLFKTARSHAGLNPDNYVDLAGYGACAGEIALKGASTQPQPPEEERPKYQVGDWVKTHEVEGFIAATEGDALLIEVNRSQSSLAAARVWNASPWLAEMYSVRVGKPHYWVRESEVIEGPRRLAPTAERPAYQVGDWVKTHKAEGLIVAIDARDNTFLVEVSKAKSLVGFIPGSDAPSTFAPYVMKRGKFYFWTDDKVIINTFSQPAPQEATAEGDLA